jgi:hypothetical protein
MNDIVIPVRQGEHNEELRYCLRSIDENLPHGKIIIAGYKPKWIKGVEYIATVPKSENKYICVARNIAAAVEAPVTSDWFTLFNDDMFVLDPLDEIELTNRGFMISMLKIDMPPQQRDSMLLTYNVLKQMKIEAPINFEVHAPMTMNKADMLSVILRIRSGDFADSPLQLRSMYGNTKNLRGVEVADPKISKRDFFAYDPKFPIVSTTDESFNHGLAGEEIRARFPKKSRYEV